MALTSPEPIGVWWRGKVKLEGEQIVPVEKNPYNPFQYYFPAGARTPKDDGTRSLPYLFLQVNAGDVREVAKFSEQYGVLGELSPDTWKDYASRSGEALWSTSRKPANAYDRLFLERDRQRYISMLAGLPPLSNLSRPMHVTQFRLAQEQLQETIELIHKAEKHAASTASKEARNKVLWRFREKLTMLRPSVAWDTNKEEWATGWDAGSLETFLYLMLLYDRQGRGQIKRCPWCKEYFMADRPKMAYCSPTHGINFRVAKHRQDKIRKRKEKH